MEVQLHAFGDARGGSKTAPRISVIIPVRNDPKRLAKCLKAIDGSSLRDFEVIVADDASTDDTATVAESMDVQLVRLPRQSGAAAARNAASEIARGEILMFIDADVCVHSDTLEVAASSLDRAGVDAVFGSYDLEPAEANLLSQYKNLAHRFYHQVSGERATTFWSGCGAIRRDVFNTFKFDAERFTRPSIEDIDLGARLTRAGKTIIINKRLQAKHLKRWTLTGIFRSDLFDRAIPWTCLILREKNLPGDLNLSAGQRIAAMLAALAATLFLVACCFRPWLMVMPVVIFGAIAVADKWTERHVVPQTLRMLAGTLIVAGLVWFVLYARWWAAFICLPLMGVVLLNLEFYQFFLGHRGWPFVAVALPMQIAYYLYSIGGFIVGHLLHYWPTPQRLDESTFRTRLYIAVATVLYVVAWALVLARARVYHTTVDFAVSDATGFYAYLPSLTIDHDLDFANQLEIQYPNMDSDYAKAMQHNRWQIGVALSIAPAFLIAHVLSLAIYHLTGAAIFTPQGYTPLYFVFCVAWIMAIGTIGMICIDRLLTERFKVRGSIVAAAVLTTWLGTNYAWYFTREPLLAHMIGASWVIFCTYLIHRIEVATCKGQLHWWQLPLLAFCASMALACRLTNAFMFPMFVYLLIVLMRQGMLWRTLKLTPLIVVGLTPLVIHLIVTKLIMGQALGHSMQDIGYDSHENFYWLHPALLRTLFSSRHGLFFATPTLLLSVWGLYRYMHQGGWRDPLLVCLVLGAIGLWYINSSWYAWWFGPSTGNRGFVELAGMFTIGFALLYEHLDKMLPRRRMLVLALLAAGVVMNYGIMSLKMLHLVEDNQTLIPWEDRIFKGKWERI